MNNITDISLEEIKGIRTGPQIEYERRQAITDLLDSNQFILTDKNLTGPWCLDIKIEESHILFNLVKDGAVVKTLPLPQAAFRSIIKDYFIITDSYAEAINSGNAQRIEAIDMGRRGIHNEGAQVLMDQLDDEAELDLDTARRLFTLICILHIRGR